MKHFPGRTPGRPILNGRGRGMERMGGEKQGERKGQREGDFTVDEPLPPRNCLRGMGREKMRWERVG